MDSFDVLPCRVITLGFDDMLSEIKWDCGVYVVFSDISLRSYSGSLTTDITWGCDVIVSENLSLESHLTLGSLGADICTTASYLKSLQYIINTQSNKSPHRVSGIEQLQVPLESRKMANRIGSELLEPGHMLWIAGWPDEWDWTCSGCGHLQCDDRHRPKDIIRDEE